MRVLLTGGTGMLGTTLRALAPEVAPGLTLLAPGRAQLDLTDRAAVAAWLAANPVDAVIHAAARVGGIAANVADPAGFLVQNLRMDDAVITGAAAAGVTRLMYLGSSCMYPRDHRQPLVEEDILAAPLEPTNEGYALAKIAGARLCDYLSRQTGVAYRALVPCNLFGTRDHFGSAAAHLLAAAVTKVVEAQAAGRDSVEIWGSGTARREFLDAAHLARFMLAVLPRLAELPALMNVGADADHSVNDYYAMAARAAGWRGRFTHDLSRPEGMRAKLMSSARARGFGYLPPTPAATEASVAAAVAACRARLGVAGRAPGG